jgi:Zn-dependent protease
MRMLDLTPAELFARIIVLVVAFTVHEFSHAFVADRFGDDTPRRQGRLTLNPLVHLDPLGSLLLIVAGFGWAKPVMVNPYALERRNRAAPMLVALAGPVSNFLLASLAAIFVQTGLVARSLQTGTYWPTAYQLVDEFVYINLLLMLFNLIPISPLDGEKILYHFLPPAAQRVMDNVRPYGPIILIAAIYLLPRLGFDLLQTVLFGPMRVLYFFLMG